jgi:hypothetical protein
MGFGTKNHCAAEDQQLGSQSGGKPNRWVCVNVMRMWIQRFDQRTSRSSAFRVRNSGLWCAVALCSGVTSWNSYSHRKMCFYASQNTVCLLWFSVHTEGFKWRLIISKRAAFIEEWHISGLKSVLEHSLTKKMFLMFITLYSARFSFVSMLFPRSSRIFHNTDLPNYNSMYFWNVISKQPHKIRKISTVVFEIWTRVFRRVLSSAVTV